MLLSSSRPASGLMGKRLLLSTKPLRISHPCCHCSYYSTTTKFDVFGNLPVPAHKRRWIPTSGTHPLGFKVGSIYAGIKPSSPSPDSQQPDLVLVSSELPSNGAAVFTKNEFPAASVTVSKGLLQKTQGYGLRGVVANSGCANLLTGQQGLDDAVAMSEEAGRYGPDKVNQDFMVMHTGMGATRLPIKNILDSIPKVHQSMGNSHNHWLEAARGLCTTDTFPKLASRTFSLPSYPDTSFSMTGLTKGAGMVHPNMATTLAIVCTDAPVTSEALQSLLSAAVDRSYNCISIEGDTSTNDMVVMLANGAAATAATAKSSSEDIPVTFHPSAPLSEQSADFIALKGVLEGFMADMAKLVVRDAEGATKFITIRIRGLASYGAAKHIASVIARSVLVKTGIYGQDPNWVGILAALGYSLIDTQFAAKGIIVPGLTSVSMVDSKNKDEICFLKRGVPAEVDGSKAKNLMAEEDIEVIVNLRDDGKEGNSEEAVYWTSDLTHDFVTMNSDVSS